MTTLYLVRHGETVENVQKVMQGQTPGTLSELGEQQAAHLCEQFRSEAIDGAREYREVFSNFINIVHLLLG